MTADHQVEEAPSWYDEEQEPDDEYFDTSDNDDADDDGEYDGSFVLDVYEVSDTALEPVAPDKLGAGDVFVLDPDAIEEVIQVLDPPVAGEGGWVVQVAAGRRRQVIGHVWLPSRTWAYRLWHNRRQTEQFAGLDVLGGPAVEPVSVAVVGTVAFQMVPLATTTGVVDVVDATIELADEPDRQLQELLADEPLCLIAWCGGRPPGSRFFAGCWQRIELRLTGPATVDGRSYSWRTHRDLSQVLSVVGPLFAPPPFLSTAETAWTNPTRKG